MGDTLPLPLIDALPMGAHRLLMLTDERLHASCGIRVAFTQRHGGVSEGPYASLNTASHVGDDPDAVLENRKRVFEAVSADLNLVVVPNQVHGDTVVTMRSAAEFACVRKRAAAGCDALVIGAEGVSALLHSADCLLCIVVSPSGGVAVAHAGWRGALAGIAGKAARALSELDGRSPSDFNAYLGPHIGPECFEVSSDIAGKFAEAYGASAVPHERHVDLSRSVVEDLTRAGLREERIVDTRVCTMCRPHDYFSYRVSQGVCGRIAALAFSERVGQHCERS